MSDFVYTARRLVDSNLGWFLRTRTTLGEAAGNELAININRDVLETWFADGFGRSRRWCEWRARSQRRGERRFLRNRVFQTFRNSSAKFPVTFVSLFAETSYAQGVPSWGKG